MVSEILSSFRMLPWLTWNLAARITREFMSREPKPKLFTLSTASA